MWTQPTKLFRRFTRRKFWASRQSAALIVTATAFLIVACSNAVAGDPTSLTSSDHTQSAASQASGETAKDLEPSFDFDLELFANDEHQAGETISLFGFAGDPVVLNFWFPSCPPCVAEMPDFEALHQKYKDDGLKVVGVQLLGLDSVEDGQTFVDRLDVNYMLGPDRTADDSGQIVMDYKISGFPTTIFIDRDQNIVKKWTGVLNFEKLEELTLAITN
ncbi:MAG: TlpA disulfide reductase family protein [SAR202 cluster bacterium]|nr:TlpA disulfide reductase family protein [SAR202 cluster bacterium]MDP6514768.1 TlpA disulfide reductase family protein [SAR202 cluster bacterium]